MYHWLYPDGFIGDDSTSQRNARWLLVYSLPLLLIAQWHHQFMAVCGFGDPVMWQSLHLQAVEAVKFLTACVAAY